MILTDEILNKLREFAAVGPGTGSDLLDTIDDLRAKLVSLTSERDQFEKLYEGAYAKLAECDRRLTALKAPGPCGKHPWSCYEQVMLQEPMGSMNSICTICAEQSERDRKLRELVDEARRPNRQKCFCTECMEMRRWAYKIEAALTTPASEAKRCSR